MNLYMKCFYTDRHNLIGISVVINFVHQNRKENMENLNKSIVIFVILFPVKVRKY